MAAVLGQQVSSLFDIAIKMASAVAVAAVHEPTSWTASWPKAPSRRTSAHQMAREPQTYTLEAVSWHWEASDCWMVIYDKVYDLTNFLRDHPGGYDVLLEHGGRDATVAFSGVGHSKQALVAMEKYCIGILVEKERMYNRSYSDS